MSAMAATEARLVPLVFCLSGLYFFYNPRVARISSPHGRDAPSVRFSHGLAT